MRLTPSLIEHNVEVEEQRQAPQSGLPESHLNPSAFIEWEPPAAAPHEALDSPVRTPGPLRGPIRANPHAKLARQRQVRALPGMALQFATLTTEQHY